MTDPWADVREEFKDVGDPLVDTLLIDADALLAAVREELLMLRKHHYEGLNFSSFEEWLDKNRPNFAALPEHLKAVPPNQE